MTTKQTTSVFEQIKSQNGEKFAKAIRNYDCGVFEIPNIVNIVKYAGREAEPIMNYLTALKDIKIKDTGTYENPLQLLKQAGYNAWYADTLEAQNAIKKYFAPGEELCTFKDPKRFQKYYIINAVKENVDEIKREDFSNPRREDKYGTSVISIQILKTGGFISIKNRYNHTVRNSDSTFNSNPDNIIPGLSASLKHYFNVDFSSQKVSLPANYIETDGHIMSHHTEVNNTYFGKDFYVKDGEIHELDKRTEIMLDYFVFNNETKTLTNPTGINDAFIGAFNDEIAGKKIRIDTDKTTKHQHIYADGLEILEVYNGEIVKLNFPNVTNIGESFLSYNTALTDVSLPNVETIAYGFLYDNCSVRKIDLSKVKTIGDCFLMRNTDLTELSLPNVENIGDYFLDRNPRLRKFYAPNVKHIKDGFLYDNIELEKINITNAITIGDHFLPQNTQLTKLQLPYIEKIGEDALSANENISISNLLCTRENNTAENTCETYNFAEESLSTKKVQEDFYVKDGARYERDQRTEIMLDCFVFNNETKTLANPTGTDDAFVAAFNEEIADKKIRIYTNKTTQHQHIYADGMKILEVHNGEIVELNFPNVTHIGNNFLHHNTALTSISLPNAEDIGTRFLLHNKNLSQLSLPKLKNVRSSFLEENQNLQILLLPNVETIEDFFLVHNKKLTELFLPKVETIGHFFLNQNTHLTNLSLPCVTCIGDSFLTNNHILSKIYLPQVTDIGHSFLHWNNALTELCLPNVKIIGDYFLSNNSGLTKITLPELQNIGHYFLEGNKNLTNLSLPKVAAIGNDFLRQNKRLTGISLPNIKNIGNNALLNNKKESAILKAIHARDYEKIRKLSKNNPPDDPENKTTPCGAYNMAKESLKTNKQETNKQAKKAAYIASASEKTNGRG